MTEVVLEFDLVRRLNLPAEQLKTSAHEAVDEVLVDDRRRLRTTPGGVWGLRRGSVTTLQQQRALDLQRGLVVEWSVDPP